MNPLLILAFMSMMNQQNASTSPHNEEKFSSSPASLHIAELEPEEDAKAQTKQFLADISSKLQQKDEEIKEKERKIHALEETIQSITKQYEDLRTIAEKYKEEAAKWHYLYLSSGNKLPER